MAEQTDRKCDNPRRIRRLIRLPEVMRQVGLGRSTIYRWMHEGQFPKPVQLGGRTVAWSQETIDQWIDERINSNAN
ncbi:AlpA family transcriptional regulator [Erythrobacter sp. SCSIO 43205]|uniref:helix-turn-helix transcriptional regulator n=1 Tax=Erythrobacter sp. SCSIO 43205 TaxID=2779361 RepID=UPI001CA9915B|nr:AlpA family transcriptional regulator [Erythrobacter sp. SCSIO 43205]UAB78937.1 AlpA family transcriptional regulator [Erythrobacter sp. SCSIO 43205]